MLIPDRVVMDQVDVLAKEVMLFSRDTLAVKMRFTTGAEPLGAHSGQMGVSYGWGAAFVRSGVYPA